MADKNYHGHHLTLILSSELHTQQNFGKRDWKRLQSGEIERVDSGESSINIFLSIIIALRNNICQVYNCEDSIILNCAYIFMYINA